MYKYHSSNSCSFIHTVFGKKMNKEIVEFIKRATDNVSGACVYLKDFSFAALLKEKFDGTIVYDTHSRHFLTVIKDCIYDIGGIYYKLSKNELEMFSRNIETDLEFGMHILRWDDVCSYDPSYRESIMLDCAH